MKNKVLTQGQKIKIARKTVGATQKDIAGDDLTKNFICLVENNRSELSFSSAKVVCKNINDIANRKGIFIDFTPEYLMESIWIQVNRILENCTEELKKYKIEKLDDNFRKIVRDIDNIADAFYSEMDINSFMTINEFIGDIYKSHFYNQDALYHYQKACETSMLLNNYKAYVNIKNKIIIIYLDCYRYDDVINNGKLVLNILNYKKIENDSAYKMIHFNMALAYKKKYSSSKCLKHIEILENEFELTQEQLMDVEILKANTYLSMDKLYEAEKIYMKILKVAEENNDTSNIARITNNLCELEITKNNNEKALAYLNESLNIQEFKSIKHKVLTFMNNTLLCIKLNLKDEVISHYIITLDLLESINDITSEKYLSNEVYNYLQNLDDVETIELILVMLEERFNKNNELGYITDIFAKVINYYMTNDKIKANIYSQKQNDILEKLSSVSSY